VLPKPHRIGRLSHWNWYKNSGWSLTRLRYLRTPRAAPAGSLWTTYLRRLRPQTYIFHWVRIRLALDRVCQAATRLRA
jgi:hypothetical protein